MELNLEDMFDTFLNEKNNGLADLALKVTEL